MEIIQNTLNCPRNVMFNLMDWRVSPLLSLLILAYFKRPHYPVRPDIQLILAAMPLLYLQVAGNVIFTPSLRSTLLRPQPAPALILHCSVLSINYQILWHQGGGLGGWDHHSVFLILTDCLVSHHLLECQRSDNARWDGTECWIIKNNHKSTGWLE